jgi:hypothetical protein
MEFMKKPTSGSATPVAEGKSRSKVTLIARKLERND